MLVPDKEIKVQIEIVNISESFATSVFNEGEYFLLKINTPFLKTGTRYELIEALCHECVHVAQYVTGINNIDQYEGQTDLEYYFSNDEMQARAYQSALTESFYEAYKIKYIEKESITIAMLRDDSDIIPFDNYSVCSVCLKTDKKDNLAIVYEGEKEVLQHQACFEFLLTDP